MIRKKIKIDRLFNRKILVIGGLLTIMAISYPLSKNISQQYKINDEIKDLQKEINNLEGKNNNLNELIKFLESDQFVDKQARLNLNLKKEGEQVVVIKNNEEASGLNTSASGNNSSETGNDIKTVQGKNYWLSNIYKWFNYFNRR